MRCMVHQEPVSQSGMRSGLPATSVTLVGRLRDASDQAAWREFDERYRGLIVSFLRRRGLQMVDAEDLGQVVVSKLVSGLRGFEYDQERGGFRAYLYRCARNALIDFQSRQGGRPATVEAAEAVAAVRDGEDAFALFEREWADHHYRLAARRYRLEVDARGGALLDGTVAGRSVANLAAELMMTEAAVYKAQQRMRDRLKELVSEQIRDEELDHERRAE